MKEINTLSPNQSQFLGGIFQSPLVTVYPMLRETILQDYFASKSSETIPDDLPDHTKINIEYAISTSEKAQEMDIESEPRDIVDATENPHPQDPEDITDELEQSPDEPS
jgi:hypothetical protein